MTPAQSSELQGMLTKSGTTVEKVGHGRPTPHQIGKILGI